MQAQGKKAIQQQCCNMFLMVLSRHVQNRLQLRWSIYIRTTIQAVRAVLCVSSKEENPTVCALNDDITPILAKISQADAIIFGSPIYFGDVSGMLRCFEERLLFPYLTYTSEFCMVFYAKWRTIINILSWNWIWNRIWLMYCKNYYIFLIVLINIHQWSKYIWFSTFIDYKITLIE